MQFGARKLVGVVFGAADAAQAARHKTREVDEILDPEPLLGEPELALARWLADYWFAPPGEAIALLLPPRMADGADSPPPRQTLNVRIVEQDASAGDAVKAAPKGQKMVAVMSWLGQHRQASADTLRQATGASLETLRRLAERGLIEITEERRFRDPLAGAELAALRTPGALVHPLTPAQIAAVTAVTEALGRHQGFLLYGVTGSGKTEVYLALIEAALARGEGAIVLVPEIALTPQLVARFRARFGDRIAALHSGLDPDARHEQWLRIRAGELPVVVGARSALFSPMPSLGLVVVDEEHEPSFKQDTAPRYHARDLALVRGHLAGVPGGAGLRHAEPRELAELSPRQARAPELERAPSRARDAARCRRSSLIDMREISPTRTSRSSRCPLFEAIRENLARDEQTILFLNRRGFAAFALCRACGQSLSCPACSVTLTWHRGRGRLICHWCDHVAARPAVCPNPECGDDALQEVGFGTERVEGVLRELLPEARVARMDRDTTRGKALNRLLDRFRDRDIDVLVGTQMVAKGHDFPGVTLVGVLLAETGLALPDLRAPSAPSSS